MDLQERIETREALVGVIGLGYVGLPAARAFSSKGFPVIGFDIDPQKVNTLAAGRSYISHISDDAVREMLEHSFEPTSDYSRLPEADAVIICVPTPLGRHQEPDLTYIVRTSESISERLRPGQLIVLESTTYPGTTREVVLPILAKSGLKAGQDFCLGYSPEREDPGNSEYNMFNIPKVVAGITEKCGRLTKLLYDQVVAQTVPVTTVEAAEAAKVLENIYRAVNIALVNELKTLFHRMDIDVFEVIEAARTKPFGFQAFYPGPGLGGHCIPIDPFYLSWKAREFGHSARFIHLAGEINTSMPHFVVQRVIDALNSDRKPLNGSPVLLLGMAYKENVDDTRESPSMRLMDLLQQRGAHVDYSDPYIPELVPTRAYKFDKSSVELTPENVSKYDCVVICTAHRSFDYELIREHARLIVDTRNVFRTPGNHNGKIFKA